MNILLFSLLYCIVNTQPVSIIKEPRARVVPEQDIIYVEWEAGYNSNGAMFTIRHRSDAQPQLPWKYVKTGNKNARIPLIGYKNGEKVILQIKTEYGGRVVEDWTQEILVAISNRKHQEGSAQNVPISLKPISGPTSDIGSIQPPLHFTADILNPTTVRLKWNPVNYDDKTEIYYLVNVKQLTTSSGSTLQNQQIKTAATSFTLGKMIAGEKYEMTIRSAIRQDIISSTASIVEITMPKDDEYYEIGNLIISSHFRTPLQGIVNLTWEVPASMENKILLYNVEYSEMGSGYWQKIQFHGASSSAALHHLKSNTEYLLRIKTTLQKNIVTESGQFRFRTPKVEKNPIHKVDVIYSHDINSVKIQWILEPHVRTENIAGYDVYVSNNKDLPDSQWKLVRLNSKESSLSLDNLKSSTVYFVRVNVRNNDGSIMRGPIIYRFKTIDTNDDEEVEGNSLSYHNTAPGEVEISWSFPKHILDSVVGATILYTNRKDLMPEQWTKIEMEDSRNTSIKLSNLREGDRYSVQIIPRLYTGDYDYESRELFEFKTDRLSTSEQNKTSDVKTLPTYDQILSGPRFEQMSHSETEFMRIVSCNPDAIMNGCAWNEICVVRVEDTKKGWCISNTLRDSVLNS